MQYLLFQEDKREDRLQKVKSRLEFLEKDIPWEHFRDILEKVYEKQERAPQGRKHYDVVLMFKIMILQSLYNMSDEDMEYRIIDSLSFQRFLGIQPEDNVPDARTIWLFRERLKTRSLHKRLFEQFEYYLQKHGYQAKGGQMVDATFVQVPRQHLTKEERRQVEDTGQSPSGWNSSKRVHTDMDAKWTKKRGRSYFGYKNHVNVDRQHKLIRRCCVTTANVHDSRPFLGLLDPTQENKEVWADSAYMGKERENFMLEKGFTSHINKRGNQMKALTEEAEQTNRQQSRIRSRVEHVFGQMHQFSRGRRFIHVLGHLRVEVKTILSNLAYNISRYTILLESEKKKEPQFT